MVSLAVTVAALVVAVVGGYYFLMLSLLERLVLKPDSFQEFPLILKTVLSHNSAVYRFGLPRPNDVLGLPIGQHISISANINGKDVVRLYTPTLTDAEKGYFDLLIKLYPQGNISKYVLELQIGDTIKVRGPKGFFTYTPNMVEHFGMVAGGTGITPMYQIITAIARNPDDKTKVTLLYGSVSELDILLKEELDAIALANPNIEVYHVLNQPPEGWTGGVGFINEEMMKDKLPHASATLQLLLCGPPPMTSAVKRAAVDLGWQKAKPVSKAGDQVFVF